ncbi:MAG: nickel transporter [Rhodocyclaceae bacterium]|nr:nickel transporter [Rhodocyclaceae bacterium]
MQLIPVVDLMSGCAVRAVRGDRARYRPVRSGLCRGCDPVVVAMAMLRHCGGRLLYVADLDALTGGPPQPDIIAELLAADSSLSIWLDAGFGSFAAWRSVREAIGDAARRVTPIFASEALAGPAEARDALARSPAILSLDRRRVPLPDRAGCWANAGMWPATVIAMSLDRVGSGDGPDLDLVEDLHRRRPDLSVVGAGGIRDAADLAAAGRGPAAGWLVASVLHDLRIPPAAS